VKLGYISMMSILSFSQAREERDVNKEIDARNRAY